MSRNIWLAYILTALKYSWFWLGIWVFFYLRFTDYAGIGLIESALIISMTLGEIPTGALADLIGKKVTLFISFILQSAGLALIGWTSNAWQLAGGVFVAGIGHAFYSGSLEALIFDTLQQSKRQNDYPQIISRINAIQLAAPAVAGLAGAFIYNFDPRLPFLLHALAYALGMIGSLMLVEPVIDTLKFSWPNFLSQSRQGFNQLTRNADILRQTVNLLVVGAVIVIMDEMLNGFLGVEFGFSAVQLGTFWAIAYLIAALIGLNSWRLIETFGLNQTIVYAAFILSLTLVVSPVSGIVIGAITLLVRFSLQNIIAAAASTTINQNTPSQYRATTLSTYNMAKNIPYVLSAFFLGSLAQIYTARLIAAALGALLISWLVINHFRYIARHH